ncbi:acetoin dehydrogenase dihydrolipoyllysine-residue acetyltransferase subunit [Pelagibius litoralis]|uniref:Acetoin dehydrogenase dihydrolipoyllysine-residue acetyltransferase subunit n=1 Tax=Pelagibius litoralis TaxID=374515 RepID=A0A967C8X3_9PROT|nr:acetoin dehydrogenase dihydrolipoyllysine-residue acetyltransferase subunit [Pelagibius litoralis]NIA68922.1 acetoin dehydrogenase dihydrolipoyllysine-residue acetyltransferase subunit [Pelagibius litoralis]
MSEAAIQAITMPKWGLAMEEGKVSAWMAEEGAAIAGGEEILEIETTKITNVFESPVAGVLRRRVVVEGETVPVGALIGVAAGAEIPDADIEAFITDFQANFVVEASDAAAAPEAETITVAGRQLSHLRMGPEDGPPVVLVHGFGGDLNGWLFNQPVLAEDHSVYALDLPGHGRAEKNVAGLDVAGLAALLADYMEAVGIGAAHLVGHSLGGAVTLKLAIDQPARVSRLTLLSPAGLGEELNVAYVKGFAGAEGRKEIKSLLQQLFADPQLVSRDMINEVQKYKRLDGVTAALNALADAVFPGGRQGLVMRDQLATLAMPVQAIWGRDDAIVPPAHGEGLPDNVTLHWLERTGHMPHMEAAGDVNRLIAG